MMSKSSLLKQNISIKSSFPGSKKVYVTGSRVDIKVPMREIELSPTTGTFGEEENLPLRVYDTSGPYTDVNYSVDITEGIPPYEALGFMSVQMLRNMKVVKLSQKIMAMMMPMIHVPIIMCFLA